MRSTGLWPIDGRLCALLIVVPLVPILPWALVDLTPLADGQSLRFEQSQTRSTTGDAIGRMNSFTATLLLVVVALAAGLFGLMRLRRAATRTADRRLLLSGWAVLLVVVLFAVLGDGSRIYQKLGNGVFERALSGESLSMLDRQLDLANAVIAFAATALATTAAAIAMAGCRIRFVTQLNKYDRLSRNLDAVLIASAVVLVAGIIHVKQWYAWPTPSLADTSKESFANLTSAFIAYQSICYVGILALIYFPAGVILDRARGRMTADLRVAVRRLSQDDSARKAGEARLATARTALTPSAPGRFEHLVRMLAILSPVLAGPITALLPLHGP